MTACGHGSLRIWTLTPIPRDDSAAVHSFGALVSCVGWSEACGEGEGLKTGGGGVARIVSYAKPRTHAQGPEFVEAAVQDAEGGVVGAGDGDGSGVRYRRHGLPHKQAVLGDTGRVDVTH